MKRTTPTLLLLVGLGSYVTAMPSPAEDRMEAETFAGLKLRNIGPALMSGRIADVAIDPSDRSTWYVAAASGNVWKTVNAGTTWSPIFDDHGSYSMGCIAIDQGNPKRLWLGTGENASQRSAGYGDGVYRSLDGGESWERMGLATSEHIGKILIDPRDSDVVYVAAQGPLWAAGGERGLYRTSDGGTSWDLVLEISQDTGVADVAFDPRDPDVLYAVSYQRRRHVGVLVAGGPESAIYKSEDGGGSWRKLEQGLPKGDVGRIALSRGIDRNRLEVMGRVWSGDAVWKNVFTSPFGTIVALDESPLEQGLLYAGTDDGLVQVSEDGGESWRTIESFPGVPDQAYVADLLASRHDASTVYAVFAPE